MNKIDEERFAALTEDPATWPLTGPSNMSMMSVEQRAVYDEQFAQWQYQRKVRRFERGLRMAYFAIMSIIIGFNLWLIWLVWGPK